MIVKLTAQLVLLIERKQIVLKLKILVLVSQVQIVMKVQLVYVFKVKQLILEHFVLMLEVLLAHLCILHKEQHIHMIFVQN